MKFTVPIQTARMLLGRPLLFAAGDDSRPVLTGIYVEVTGDGSVQATAADGFRLGTQIAKGADNTQVGAAIIPAAAAREAMKTWPKTGNGEVTVTTTATKFVLRCVVFEPMFGAPRVTEVEGDLISGPYPKYRDLFSASLRYEGGQVVAINASFLAMFERVARLDPYCEGVTRIYMGEPSEPVTFQIKGADGGGGFIGLVMPMYVQWSEEDSRERLLADIGVAPKPKRRRTRKAA